MSGDEDAVLAKLDALQQDLRRQGRATVAAQAAAEACLERVGELAQGLEAHAVGNEETSQDVLSLLRSLLPAFDALDRAVAEARRAAAAPKPSLFERLRGKDDARRSLERIASGLSMLRDQVDDALRGGGVEIDRQAGVDVDGEAHRVVETRERQAGEAEGVVVEVVRPGYTLGGRRLREADVVASRGTK